MSEFLHKKIDEVKGAGNIVFLDLLLVCIKTDIRSMIGTDILGKDVIWFQRLLIIRSHELWFLKFGR